MGHIPLYDKPLMHSFSPALQVSAWKKQLIPSELHPTHFHTSDTQVAADLKCKLKLRLPESKVFVETIETPAALIAIMQ